MNFAIILAGGIGSRLHYSSLPKQYIDICGKPVLVYTLEKFQACPAVDRIILVANKQWKKSILAWCEQFNISKLLTIAEPGETRQESILSGLLACEPHADSADDIVTVHDAARPLVSCQLIESSIQTAKKYDGCLPVISIKDAVFFSQDGQTISGLTDRSTLFCGQTPESFKLSQYLDINKSTSADQLKQIRGSSELAFLHGLTIQMIPGEETNFKLTTQEDLDHLTRILNYSN